MIYIYSDPYFDPEEDKYMGLSLHMRGDYNIRQKERYYTQRWLKDNKKYDFLEWSYKNFQLGLNPNVNQYPKQHTTRNRHGDILHCICYARNGTLIANNTCMERIFDETIVKKFDLMYSQRAFVHWYVRHGMEEGEFEEARENIAFLLQDYLDVLDEGVDSNDDDEDNQNDGVKDNS